MKLYKRNKDLNLNYFTYNTDQQKTNFSTDSKPILPPEFRYYISFSLARPGFNQKQLYYLISNLTKKNELKQT